nr:MAG TPA: hypothetical protein [Caudoviricetes sp.]
MKKSLLIMFLACVLGLNIYTLSQVSKITQKEQEKQEFVADYKLKDKQILDAYIENGDHKLVLWSEDKKSKIIITLPKETWQLSIIGKVYNGKI